MSATQTSVLRNSRETACNGKEEANMTKNKVLGKWFWSGEIGRHGFFNLLKVGDDCLFILKTLLILFLAASSDAGVRMITLSMIEI